MAEKKESKEREVIRHGMEDLQTFYSNNVEIRGTQWDVRLTFGELIEVTEERLEVKNLTVVYMSPQHAKRFAATLVQNIYRHEKTFGPISSVDDFSVEIEESPGKE